MFPGGWQLTPIDRKVEENFRPRYRKNSLLICFDPHPRKHCHIEAPAITTPDMSLRKREASLQAS